MPLGSMILAKSRLPIADPDPGCDAYHCTPPPSCPPAADAPGPFLQSVASGWTMPAQRRRLPPSIASAASCTPPPSCPPPSCPPPADAQGPLLLERRQRVDGDPPAAAGCPASPAPCPPAASHSTVSGWSGLPASAELPAAELPAGRRCSGPLPKASPAVGRGPAGRCRWLPSLASAASCPPPSCPPAADALGPLLDTSGWTGAHRPLPLAAQPRQRAARRPLPLERRQRVDGGPPDTGRWLPSLASATLMPLRWMRTRP